MLSEDDIIFHDNALLAINKPSGLLVHRSPIDRNETRFALQEARNLIGQRVYPVHRLDKPTSGVLLFALSSEYAADLSQQFMSKAPHKEYLAICRGFSPLHIDIDHPLKLTKEDTETRLDKEAIEQDAHTSIKQIARCSIDAEIDRYPQTRLSLVHLSPSTGRRHQLRRHLKHISHPIIGDAKYGKGKYNRYFAEHFGSSRLLLHCAQMSVQHPSTGNRVTLRAKLDSTFTHLIDLFGWQIEDKRHWQHMLELIERTSD